MIDIPRVNFGLSYVQFTEPVPILGVFGIAKFQQRQNLNQSVDNGITIYKQNVNSQKL